ncbi:MAG: STAS domain-containing protein [Chitinispirillaceae bacterium]|nr:STAS domain-containing protein [Chitinispirillaceae bacterium]
MMYEFEKVGKFTMIRISGNLDNAESTKRLDSEIAAMSGEGCHHFVFNLERTTYLDSAGLSIFIHCLCDVQENDGSVFIIAEDNQVRRVLEMVGINRLITTYGSRKDFLDAQEIPAA